MFVSRWSHYQEALHIRLHPNNINRYSGIEIPKAGIPWRLMRTYEGTDMNDGCGANGNCKSHLRSCKNRIFRKMRSVCKKH